MDFRPNYIDKTKTFRINGECVNDPQGKEGFPKLYTQSINGKEKRWIKLTTLKSELPFIQGHQKQDVKKLTH